MINSFGMGRSSTPFGMNRPRGNGMGGYGGSVSIGQPAGGGLGARLGGYGVGNGMPGFGGGMGHTTPSNPIGGGSMSPPPFMGGNLPTYHPGFTGTPTNLPAMPGGGMSPPTGGGGPIPSGGMSEPPGTWSNPGMGGASGNAYFPTDYNPADAFKQFEDQMRASGRLVGAGGISNMPSWVGANGGSMGAPGLGLLAQGDYPMAAPGGGAFWRNGQYIS